MKELIELLSQYFKIGDSYHYILGRHKEAFGLGLMDVDDFREYTDEDVAEIAAYLTENGVTVQRYIQTAERLPCEEDANASEQVMAYYLNHKRWERTHISWIINHPDWYSHWTPIIEPSGPPGKE